MGPKMLELITAETGYGSQNVRVNQEPILRDVWFVFGACLNTFEQNLRRSVH